MSSHSIAQEREPDNEEAVVVFVSFCAKCRTIVGDSYSWEGNDKDLNLVIHYDKTEDTVCGETLQVSREGVDVGSTFYILFCKICQTEIGRKYASTPRAFDDLRDRYAFFFDKIQFYQLGPSIEAVSRLEFRMEQILDIPTSHALLTQIRKAQHVICNLNERIIQLETRLSIANPLDPSEKDLEDVSLLKDLQTGSNSGEPTTLEKDESFTQDKDLQAKKGTPAFKKKKARI